MNQSQTNRVDTLIITVGTRQVGWRCQDGAIRSFGADGNISYPSHVDELYQELGIQRGIYSENGKSYPWSAQDLGKRFYDYCVHWLDGDFSPVELLLDEKIVEVGVKCGLRHIILWGTDQPNSVSWFYRRLDTLWLAQLMASKIKSIYPELRVDVHTPTISANDSEAIRAELENLVLQEAINSFSPSDMEQEFVLWIQNKGCTPAIASGVEICAAALVRQCEVFNAIPNEPNTFFETLPNGSQSACPAQEFKLIPMGEYFWPLERLRVISAWQRGDFSEAQIWLKPHQIRYKVLYKLAGILSLYTNWETDNFVKRLRDWLRSNDLAQVVTQEQISIWQAQLLHMRDNELQKAWETTFLIELPLLRKNYTLAFIQFTQTLERLLSIQCCTYNWVDSYQPGLSELIEAWCRFRNFCQDSKWYQLLYRLRKKRNQVIHSGEFVTWEQMRSLWTTGNLFSLTPKEDPLVVKNLMLDVLKQVSAAPNSEQLLVRSLFEWGLNYINDADQ